MTFRAKLFILFSLAALAGSGLLVWGGTRMARRQFEQFGSARSATLAAQFQLEFARRSQEVTYAMQGLADAEGTLRMALDLSRAQADPSVYATDGRGLAAAHHLDFLDLVAGDGTLITSAQWTARSGYKNDWVAAEQDWNRRGAFLQRVELPDGVDLGLLAVRVVSVGASNLYLIGGQRVDREFLSALAIPAGTRALLYRNLEAGFAPESLAGADGPVEQAARFEPVVESAENRQGPSQQTIQWTADPASAESFTTLPLTGRQNQPLAVVLVGSTQQELVALINSIRLAALLAACVGILGSLFLSGWVAGRVTKPVESLSAGVRQVTAGNWAAQVDVPSRGEAGQLARDFNEMTKRLTEERARLVQTERVAAWRDVAQRLTHEVKQSLFPLEVTVGSLTRARAESSPRFGEIVFEAIGSLRSDLDNLKASVLRFGEFAKMPPPRLKPLDVNDLLRAVLKDFEPQFRVVGRPPITPELYLDGNLSKIQGDADQLHKALDNLLVHSIDTMPAGGTLTVRTAQKNGIVRVEVSGGGVALAPDQSARLFSASRNAQASSAGLGLATTQAVVSDHGGKFFADAVPGVGTTFRLEFPVVTDVAPPAVVNAVTPRREIRREMPEIPQIPQVDAEATVITAPAPVLTPMSMPPPEPEPAAPESSLPVPSLKGD